jgi:NRPS condensation-like uncharacterized protein
MSDVRMVLVDRLFLLLDGLQGPSSLNLYSVSLDRPLEPGIFKAAVADLLAEQALLRTRALRGSWSLRRYALPVQDVDEVLFWGQDSLGAGWEAPEELAFMRRPLDLSTQPPVRILARPSQGGARVVMGLHHSVADGVGGYFVLDRLAAHYTARLGGQAVEAAPVAPARAYRSYFRRFKPVEKRRAIFGMGNVLKEMLFDLGPYAMFGDVAPPAQGQFAWRELVLPESFVPALRAGARERGGTLNDLLLAATAEAGVATWPVQDHRPVLVMIPVSLRDGPTVDMTNRVAELPIRLPADACLDFEAAFAVVKERTPLARDRGRAFARICQYGIASWLPPKWVRPIVARSLARPENHALTYVFSNTGVLDPQPRDFGPAKVLSVAGQPPLTFPPGLGIVAATARGRLTLTVAWVDPVLRADRVELFCAALLRRLGAIASQHPSV